MRVWDSRFGVQFNVGEHCSKPSCLSKGFVPAPGLPELSLLGLSVE